MAEIRYPKITEATTDGQLRQMKDYLHQLTNQLNFALKTTDEKMQKYEVSLQKNGSSAVKSSVAVGDASSKSAEELFVDLKALIIKSADIVAAYYEVIEERLKGKYVAESDFGEYKKEVEGTYLKTPENFTSFYDSIQTIVSKELDGLSELRSQCYIKTGYLDDNNATAGIEIGLAKETNSDEADTKFARFTQDALTFYDRDGTELAIFSPNGNKFTFTKFIGNLELGRYMLDTSNGIAFKWLK